MYVFIYLFIYLFCAFVLLLQLFLTIACNSIIQLTPLFLLCRFSFPEVSANYTPGQTNDSYQWNPCDSWTAKTSPNETTKNDCKEVAVS